MYYKLIENYSAVLRNPSFCFDFFVRNSVKLMGIKIRGRKKQSGSVCGKRIISLDEANEMIYNKLSSDRPCMISRNGGTETTFIVTEELIKLGLRNSYSKEFLDNGKDKSGIFPPTEETAFKFSQIYKESMVEADMTVYWGHILMEEYFFKKFMRDTVLFPSRALEPFTFSRPWTLALKNKKVLLVHPFVDLIAEQYKIKDKLFSREILPDFKLYTVKAIQSIADADCGFDSWFEALNHMYGEIAKVDYDIAILGCGAYAVPLAAMIKKSGKKAIILGGVTQFLFGIKGSRWERSRPDIVAMYNEYWVRPGERYKPKGAEKTEGAAYW